MVLLDPLDLGDPEVLEFLVGLEGQAHPLQQLLHSQVDPAARVVLSHLGYLAFRQNQVLLLLQGCLGCPVLPYYQAGLSVLQDQEIPVTRGLLWVLWDLDFLEGQGCREVPVLHWCPVNLEALAHQSAPVVQ